MSLYPTLNLDTLAEELNQALETTTTNMIGKVFLLEFIDNKARVVIENGKLKEAETVKEKIQMYIQVLLRTELDKYYIYENTKFGMTYFKFRGQKLPQSFIIAEIKREIEENLLRINLIDSINNFTANMTLTTVNISFEVILKDGDILIIEV